MVRIPLLSKRREIEAEIADSVGGPAVVVKRFCGTHGRVRIGKCECAAELSPGSPKAPVGDRVRVVEVRGRIAIVCGLSSAF